MVCRYFCVHSFPLFCLPSPLIHFLFSPGYGGVSQVAACGNLKGKSNKANDFLRIIIFEHCLSIILLFALISSWRLKEGVDCFPCKQKTPSNLFTLDSIHFCRLRSPIHMFSSGGGERRRKEWRVVVREDD